ncbi:MAG TPA: AbiV family abortive infection protein [Candidatus Methylomirabilis sp.]|nr:AbiV family abortive infection protein [Candidatus Methylomirabilis sp.]
MKKRLDQYSGHLNAAHIAEGINLARRNANRLAADSAALLDAGRLPSAAALAVLAIEEAGKCSILREIALAREEKELLEAWRSYRSHTTKNRTWPFVELFFRGARKLNDFAPLFEGSNRLVCSPSG